MNLLELIQQVADELGITRPATVVGNQDPQTRQLLALLNRLGADLCRQFDWQRLNVEHIDTTQATSQNGTTTAGSAVVSGLASTAGLSNQWAVLGTSIPPFAQIVSVGASSVTMNMPATASGTSSLTFSRTEYPLPANWLKQIPQTEWDRTNRWPLLGPKSPQEWQSFKSGIVYAGPRQRFRILQNTIAINPPPPAGLMFSFEYISNGWVISGTARSEKCLADTDEFIFSDSLLITGLKAQWKAAKGLDASFDLGEFRVLLENNKAQDKSDTKLSLSPYGGTVLMTEWNTPDGNWSPG